MKRIAILVAFGVWGTASGCGSYSNQLTEYGLEHGRHSLRVAYVGNGRFAGPDWRVDNLVRTRLGAVMDKRGPEYSRVIGVDAYNDGTVSSRETVPRYELRLVHNSTPGLIWLSHLTLPSRFRNNTLSTLARLYVDSVAGAGIEVSSFGGVEVTRYATRILSEESRAVDGYEAHHVVFEVADVDQLQLSRDARWRRAELLLVRSGFLWPHKSGRIARLVPTVLVVGHENFPENFLRTSAAFNRLVASIDFRRDENEALFDAIARCTNRHWVRGQRVTTNRRGFQSDLTEEESDCVFDAVPVPTRGFAFRRTRFVPQPAAPEVAPAPAATSPTVPQADAPPSPVRQAPSAEPAPAE